VRDLVYTTKDSVEAELAAGLSRIKYSPQMLEEVRNKEEGWQGFLRQWGLWDERLTERDAYLRYLRFKDVTFGEAPDAMKR
jgi:hypothetical protein